MEADTVPQFILNSPVVTEIATFTTKSVIALILTVVLLLVSALLSGAENAYMVLRQMDQSKPDDSRDNVLKRYARHFENPEQMHTTIVICSSFINISVILGITLFFHGLLTDHMSSVQAYILLTVVAVSMILIFGEVLPRIFAWKYPVGFAGLMIRPLSFLKKLLWPFLYISAGFTGLANKRLAGNIKGLSLDDISQALDFDDESISEGRELLKGIVTFGNTNVVEIMTARVDVVDIDIESDFTKVIGLIVESGYSRMPVYEDGPDDVKGILYIKDLLPHLDQDSSFEWQKLIRPAYYVPETKKINDLLQEFKTQKIHMAIVVDEYGGTSGIVTLEDILEEIVGDISDELDDDEVTFTKLPDGSFIFEGKTLLKDFFRITEVSQETFISLTDEPETLAGLILELKGAIPARQEVIEHSGYKFTILASDNRRIKKVKFSRI